MSSFYLIILRVHMSKFKQSKGHVRVLSSFFYIIYVDVLIGVL